MPNRIREVRCSFRLDPVESVVEIAVRPDHVAATTELRGQLVGPRCAVCSTLEVAHPLRQARPEALDELRARVVLPEAGFWDPERPFLYDGSVELWEADGQVDEHPLKVSLRSIGLGPGGLRINGRPLTLRGVERDRLAENDAAALRQAGINLLLAPVSAVGLWDAADRLGFLVLGRLTDAADWGQTVALSQHPCSLGWLLPPELERPVRWPPFLVGYDLGQAEPRSLPEPAHFTLRAGTLYGSGGQALGHVQQEDAEKS